MYRLYGSLMVGTALALALPAAAAANEPAALPMGGASCTTSEVSKFLAGDPLTKVVAVRGFAKGATLISAGTGPTTMPVAVTAANELCMVKIVQGPGNPGPDAAPSTQKGIGIEIWLPNEANWNGRIHNLGGGGFQGLPEISDSNAISGFQPGVTPYGIAGEEGAVSAVNDTGHVTLPANGGGGNGDFLMLPDGSINRQEWQDFAHRASHVTAEKTKVLAAAFYGKPARKAYFEGCSTGGRQGLKEAQVYPADYDGLVIGAPAINWTTFITSELYPQILMQRELGKPIDGAKLALVSAAAVSACDMDKAGKHIGYITDPARCRYDPEKDTSILCADSAAEATSRVCLTPKEAAVVNRIWYGQTADGQAPSPTRDNGYNPDLNGRTWYGITRGTQPILAMSVGGNAVPFPIATSQVALNLQDASLAGPFFRNASKLARDGWKQMNYADLARSTSEGKRLQSDFSHIDANSPDLDAFKARGGKLIIYHGMADQLITIEGTQRYLSSVEARYGGKEATKAFIKYYEIAGMGHCNGVGSVDGLPGVSPKAAPHLPKDGEFYASLVSWVEGGTPLAN